MTRATESALSPDRRRELLAEAERLAGRLAGGEVGRTELSYLVNLLFYVPGPWPERLAEGRRLLETLPRSGLKKRSKTMPKKIKHMQEILGPVLLRAPRREELRFLLGWLMRLLVVRAKKTPTL